MERPAVIGVRELRTHLSAYLRAVARGETVTIGAGSKLVSDIVIENRR